MAIQNAINSGKRIVYSSTQPTPSTDIVWFELDGSGNVKYGWGWYWDGTYWRSSDQRISFNVSALAAAANFYFNANNAFSGYYFEELNLVSTATVAQSAINNNTITLNRLTSNATATSIATFTTNGNAANTWTRNGNSAINVATSLSTQAILAFTVAITRNGVPGTLNGSIEVVYNYIR